MWEHCFMGRPAARPRFLRSLLCLSSLSTPHRARVACCDLKWVPRIRESDSERRRFARGACSLGYDWLPCENVPRLSRRTRRAERAATRDNALTIASRAIRLLHATRRREIGRAMSRCAVTRPDSSEARVPVAGTHGARRKRCLN